MLMLDEETITGTPGETTTTLGIGRLLPGSLRVVIPGRGSRLVPNCRPHDRSRTVRQRRLRTFGYVAVEVIG